MFNKGLDRKDLLDLMLNEYPSALVVVTCTHCRRPVPRIIPHNGLPGHQRYTLYDCPCGWRIQLTWRSSSYAEYAFVTATNPVERRD